LFLHVKKHVTGQKFHKDEEVKNKSDHVVARADSRHSSVTDTAIPELVPSLNKCLDKVGDYDEK
jgi:hypothetical protein